jgi:sugar (pentulose or hexulose) kinase
VSVLGLDVGSTAVKAAAYSETGHELARAQQTVPSSHDQPGHWQVDGDAVWRATVQVIRQVTAASGTRKDPPRALAVSASGRESFPARADGSAIGPCLRTADARRSRTQATDVLPWSPEQWVRACGHVPDHMDPANRLLWWRETSPDALAEARWFLGWHELASLKLVGRPLIDPALAAGFFLFDLRTQRWSEDRLNALGVDRRVLPEIAPWGVPIDNVHPRAADELGLPAGCAFVVGSWDASCAAVGSGAVGEGVALLSAGTWESVVVPARRPGLAEAASSGLAVTPHPSEPGLGLWARSPNGTSALDWALAVASLRLEDLEAGLLRAGQAPADVVVVPHLSGAGPPWQTAQARRGAVFGLTLATTPLDLVRATMEGIACDLRFAISAMREAATPVRLCRAAGGGSKSGWWMQLKADLLGIPVEVPEHSEPGTLGAALLAGVGVRAYASLAEAAERVSVAHRYQPSAERAAAFADRLEAHRAAVASMPGSYRPGPSIAEAHDATRR